jgi:hypothetical protein
VRWSGLAGAVALAVAAYLGGSGYTRGPSVNAIMILSGRKGVLLPVCWVLGTALVLAAWWVGRRVVPSTRWALVTAGLWWLPVLPVLPMGSADIYSYTCQGYVQYAGGDPYGSGVRQFGCPWLSSMDHVWQNSPAPYGPLFLLLAAGAVAVAGVSLAAAIAGLRVIALGGLALVAVGMPVLARRAGVDPAKAAWTVLACPLVLIHLVSGAHNDALMVGLLVAGLAVVAARRDPASLLGCGALLGLAGSVKATALVVLPFAILAAVPPGSSLRALWRPAALVAAGAAGAMGLVSLISGRGVGWVAGLQHSGDTVEWTSPSTAVGLTVDYFTDWNTLGVTRAIGVVVLVVVLVWLWWRARTRDALLGAGLALAATVLCAPVFHPWYATWPLAVLAAVLVAGRLWVLIPCAVAAILTTPAGYNWALATRVPGSLLMTTGLVVAAVYGGRRWFGTGRRSADAVPEAP